MITPDTLRRLLEVADVRRAPYAVAAASASLLERDPADRQALGHYVRALAALELGVAARRILSAIRSEHSLPADISGPIERLPSGVIAWSSRRRRFQANLRALEACGVAGAPLLAAWEDPAERCGERYELHQAVDGNFFVADTHAGQPGGALPAWKSWLGGGVLMDFRGATATIVRSDFEPQPRLPLAFDGIGYAWLVPHVLAISDHAYMNYSPPVYVVEPDLPALCMVLHMHDLQACLASGRLRLFAGPDGAERFTTALREHSGWTPPGSFVFHPLRPRPALDLQGRVESMTAERAAKRQQTAQRVAAYYARFDAAAWHRRFAEAGAQGPPLRVLGITTRYSTVLRYSMEELQRAANAGSGTCRLQMEISQEPDDQSLEIDALERIDRFQPDLLVTISRLRHEDPDLPRNVPALCWDQDNLPCMRLPAVLEDLKGLTFVAGHGAVSGILHLGWPHGACILCHPAGRTHHYQPGTPTAEERSQFGSDVSYLSHASGAPEALRDSFRPKWQDDSRRYLAVFDGCTEQVLQRGGGTATADDTALGAMIRAVAEDAKVPLTPALEQSFLMDLRLIRDRMFRHEALHWASDWCASRGKRMRLWGNGWENHPTLSRWAAGTALPGEQAETVFRATILNLQLIETGILHSRLLDGWAAGGFFLIRETARGPDDARMRTEYRIGQLAQAEDITTLGQLEKRGSAEIRGLWARLAANYTTRPRDHLFPEFRVWRCLVPPQVLVPILDRLTFSTAAEFAKLADDYCANEALRRGTLDDVRQILLTHLSYDARWRDFIGHITMHLGYASS
jgi:hypothetical protein